MYEERHPNEHQEDQPIKQRVDPHMMATTYAYQRPAIQAALLVLWRIYTKQTTIGARLFYEELKQSLPLSKDAYKEALAFLEGAGVVINEVVVENKVPPTLVKRYGLMAHDD